MKKLLLSLSLLVGGATLVVTQQSCVKEIAKAAFNEFNTEPQTVNFRIPILASANSNFIVLDSMNTNSNLDQVIRDNASNQFGIDDVDQIHFHSVKLVLTDADATNNWANFTAIGAKMKSNTQTTYIDMGQKNNIPDSYSTELELDVNTTVQAKDYLRGNVVTYQLLGTNRRATTHDLHGTAYVSFTVQ
jgi:hypothetical protein